MNINQALQIAWRNLFVNKKRSLQVMLAFVVGVGALVAVFVLSQTIVNRLNSYAKSYNPNSFYITMVKKENSSISFTPEDMLSFAKSHSDIISSISPCIAVDASLKYGDKTFEQFEGVGVNEDFIDTFAFMKIDQGRWLSYMDITRRQNVCVLDSNVAQEIIGDNAIGKYIRINDENYMVIGVVNGVEGYEYEDEWSNYVYIPYTKTQQRLLTNVWNEHTGGYWCNYFVKATSEENMATAMKLIADMLDERLGDDKAVLFQSFKGMFSESGKTITNMFMPILLSAFIVVMLGCAGIMNMMIASVGERNKEIGIRKAFGATRKDIQQQFMLESVVISVLGSAVGVLCGAGFSVAFLLNTEEINAVSGDTVVDKFAISFDWGQIAASCGWVLLLALGFAALVGVVSGAYPANLAAKMEIVDAINSD